jgi:hypothetical protein
MSDNWQKSAIELHSDGYSYRAIGRLLGKNESVVRRYLNRIKVEVDWEGGEDEGGIDGSGIGPVGKQKEFLEKDHERLYGGVRGTLSPHYYSMMMESLATRTDSGARFQMEEPGKYSKLNVNPEDFTREGREDNSRILLISDPHFPYNHPDIFEFLQHLKEKYQPTRVICMGDEADNIALSYHEKELEAPSAHDEIKLLLPSIKRLEQMFPVMDLLDSNHGSLVYRKAKTAGIPKHYFKSYNEVLGVGPGWKWHHELVIDLPNGNSCYLHHGKSSNITKTSQAMSMCAAAGHYHNTFKIEYWANPKGLYWAMQTGCLIDDKSFAFNYNNVNLHRPLIGTGLIIDSLPVLEAMVLDKGGRWVGRTKREGSIGV